MQFVLMSNQRDSPILPKLNTTKKYGKERNLIRELCAKNSTDRLHFSSSSNFHWHHFFMLLAIHNNQKSLIMPRNSSASKSKSNSGSSSMQSEETMLKE